jgi:hypothetical protein
VYTSRKGGLDVGNMPTYHVTKGSEFGYLSKLFGPPAANFMPAYDAALAQLDAAGDAASTVQAAANKRRTHPSDPALSTNNVSHFEKHWLAPAPDGWWTHKHPVADVLRAGMREAIKHARARSLPMEVLWVCAKDDDFQVYYSESPTQVTVIIFTPPAREHVIVPSPGFTPQWLDEPENIWVVKLNEPLYDGAAYQALGGPASVVSPAQPVATVTSGPAGSTGDPIIQQRLYHTAT